MMCTSFGKADTFSGDILKRSKMGTSGCGKSGDGSECDEGRFGHPNPALWSCGARLEERDLALICATLARSAGFPGSARAFRNCLQA